MGNVATAETMGNIVTENIETYAAPQQVFVEGNAVMEDAVVTENIETCLAPQQITTAALIVQSPVMAETVPVSENIVVAEPCVPVVNALPLKTRKKKKSAMCC